MESILHYLLGEAANVMNMWLNLAVLILQKSRRTMEQSLVDVFGFIPWADVTTPPSRRCGEGEKEWTVGGENFCGMLAWQEIRRLIVSP